MVALYWLLNFLFTYWFISDVLPTLRAAAGRCQTSTLDFMLSSSERSKRTPSPPG